MAKTERPKKDHANTVPHIFRDSFLTTDNTVYLQVNKDLCRPRRFRLTALLQYLMKIQ